jgi:hypothetical protein
MLPGTANQREMGPPCPLTTVKGYAKSLYAGSTSPPGRKLFGEHTS